MATTLIKSVKRKKEWVNSIMLFFLYSFCLFVVYAKYFFADQIPLSGDGLTWITDLSLLQNGIAVGEIPLWNKYLAGGIPFTANLIPQMLLGFLPVKIIVYINYIGMVALGGICAFAFFRRMGCSPWAALTISTCFLLSIHLGGARKSHISFLLTYAMVPVVMCVTIRYFEAEKIRWLIFSSALMALQFWVGALQPAIYADAFYMLFLIVFGVHYKIKWSRMIRHGLIWGFVYLGLIAWKLVPSLEITKVYAEAGAVSITDYNNFIYGSIHPVKLLQTIFPRIFGKDNIFLAFGFWNSSEMDIEIFLGHMMFVLVVLGAYKFRSDYRIRFFFFSMLLSFAYSALGHIRPLADLIYNIPIINGFRVPARALFLFIFSEYSIAAIVLSELHKESFRENACRKAGKIYGIILLVTTAAVAGAGITNGIQTGFTKDSFAGLMDYLENSILPECVIMVLCVLVLFYLMKPAKMLRRKAYQITCAVILLITVFETFSYTTMTQPDHVSSLTPTDYTSERIKEEIGDGKVWDAFAFIDGAHQSIISQSKAQSKGIPSVNAYSSFNNPRLYRMLTQDSEAPLNYSGLLTGSMKADQNAHLQNALLSMLGIKYIIDSDGLLVKDTSSYIIQNEPQVLTECASCVIPYDENNVSSYFEPFEIEKNTYYQVTANCDTDKAQTIRFDLYGGESYDKAEQEVVIALEEGHNEISVVVYSGDYDETKLGSIYWRFFGKVDIPLELTNVTLSKIRVTEEKDTYQRWLDTEDSAPIYLNTKARDILYVPDAVETIEDEKQLYEKTWAYQLDKVNYVTDEPARTIHSQDVDIRDIHFGYNAITAHITSPEEAVLNFSQCWYPGWRGYIDEKEVPVQRVNGLIMGMDLPSGEYDVKFVFVPTVFFCGVGVSLFTLLLVIIGGVITKQRKKKLADYVDQKR